MNEYGLGAICLALVAFMRTMYVRQNRLTDRFITLASESKDVHAQTARAIDKQTSAVDRLTAELSKR